MEMTWEQTRIGEIYNTITRQVVPRYSFTQRERSVETFSLTTDAEGTATREITLPDNPRASYFANLTTVDGNGRTITHRVFIGRDFWRFFMNAEDNMLFLDGVNEDGYDIGDEVELTVMLGTEAVTQGNFMFVVVQGGIMSYHVGMNPLKFTFGEKHVPDVQVYAFHFNGHIYTGGWAMTEWLRFNTDSRIMEIEISTDADEYRPGDTVTLTISTTDAAGNPLPANVNISLVDEALFALMNYEVDTLRSLYRSVSGRLRLSFSTHQTFVSDGIDDVTWATAEEERVMAPMATPATESADAGGGGDDTRIRRLFEDTATFISLRTDANGFATYTFTLPDNITSWRMTSSGISTNLYVGNSVQNVRVTLPMFLHYALASNFLAGDRPYVGLNAYGTSLTGGEVVTFEVWREDNPSDVRSATGVAFERVNIPLWEKTEEGSGALIMKASVAGFADAVQHTYTVVGSNRLVDTAVFYEVTPGIYFDVNPGGLTNITFTDRGRGQFLFDLLSMRNSHFRSGARLEGFILSREAQWLLETYFHDVQIFGAARSFDISDYQQTDGGLAMLPYGNSNLQTTVDVLPFVLNEINIPEVTRYLRTIADTSTTDNRLPALYGLALLGQPVLLELERQALPENMLIHNTAYIARAFIALGETQTARMLYNERILPHIENLAPFYRVNDGGNRAAILEATSVVALLAAELGTAQSEGLHRYAGTHRFDANNREQMLLQSMERLTFISHEISRHSGETASITYTLFGETVTRELGHGRSFNLRIPAQSINEFNLIAVSGVVSAVSIVRTPLEEIEAVETGITITRRFLHPGTNTAQTTFNQGDLVRVEITVEYGSADPRGNYIVTDFLPAGLTHIRNSARFDAFARAPGSRMHVTTEGQRITFFDFDGGTSTNRTYVYHARVITPGTFTAEGVMIQSSGAREFMTIGENATITIRP